MATDDILTRRRFLRATGAAAAATAVAGCSSNSNGGSGNGSNGGGNDSGTQNSGGGTQGAGSGTQNTSGGNQSEEQNTDTGGNAGSGSSDTLRVIAATLDTFDPIASTENESLEVIQQMFDGLTFFPNGDPEVKSLLAKDYDLSKDKKTYTFTLNDATFHNGDDVSADDFVYSFERLAASKNSQRSNYLLDSLNVAHKTDSDENYVSDSLAVEAADPKTLRVTLTQPFHAALELLAYPAFAAVPKGIVGDLEGVNGKMEYKKFANGPVGAGPFEFKNYNSGTSVAVERFDDYWKGAPAIGGVHWQIMEKDSTIYNYITARNVDHFEIPTSQYDPSKVKVGKGGSSIQGPRSGTYGPLQNGATVQYSSIPLLGTYYIGFNMAAVPKPVRQAFAYTLNQEIVTQKVFKGRGVPAYYLTPPSLYPGGAKAATKHAKKSYPYGYNESQLDKARSLMEKEGYDQNNQYTVQWTQYQDSTWLEIGKLLRDQLQTAHIDMKIQQADFSTEIQRGVNGKLEAYTLGWTADWPSPDNFLQLLNPPQTDTSSAAPISYTNWSQKTGDAANKATKAYEKVTANYGPSKSEQKSRNEAYVSIEDANWEDVSLLPIYNILSEMFTYDGVTVPATGSMGSYLQKYDEVKISRNNG